MTLEKLIRDADPVRRIVIPDAHSLEARRTLRELTASPPARRRRRRAVQRGGRRVGLGSIVSALAVSLAVVFAGGIAVLFSTVRTGSTAAGGAIVFRAQPLDGASGRASIALIDRAVKIMQQRSDALAAGARISRVDSEIGITPPAGGRISARVVSVLSATGRMAFYDWEANALTPNGRTVASQLGSQDATALKISQGSGVAAPGEPGAGSLQLYDAVKLASKQPKQISKANGREGSQYYLFGAPGSPACTTVAKHTGQAPLARVHCLLSGPDSNEQDLFSGMPANVSVAEGEMLVVKRGTVVLQAANQPTASTKPAFGSPTAQYYVLSDRVALFGHEVTNAKQSTDATGAPDVSFGFTPAGSSAFQRATATIARRGQTESALPSTLDQHFAIALDNQLITVPSIDFRTYPDGITGNQSADIGGSFTVTTAKNLATELRLGALPVQLTRATQ